MKVQGEQETEGHPHAALSLSPILHDLQCLALHLPSSQLKSNRHALFLSLHTECQHGRVT